MSHFDKPKFQNIIQFFLNNNCDLEEQILNNRSLDKVQTISNSQLPLVLQKSMRLFIIEIIPSILVSDGHNFIEAVFTKESINEFRKNHSHVKFSSLRDKVIYVSKWRLQLENVDSRKVFNSYNNLSIKIIVEAFKPIMYETLNQRLTHGSTSVFRDPNIQVLVKSFRHWFSQTLINLNVSAIDSTHEFADFPSLAHLTAPSTIDSSQKQNDSVVEQENNFGANIQNTQVFRVDKDFKNPNDIKVDSFNDMVQFSQEVIKKRDIQIKDIRLSDLDRIIIQEKGEQFYAEKKFSKSRQWQDTVEDEWRREQLRLRLEYFQISQKQSQEAHYYETKWQNEERQKSYNRAAMRSTRRIAGYTLGNSVQSIKEKLVRLLTTSKFNTVECGGINSTSPIKGSGRPRSNSQENILQSNDMEDSKSNLLETQYMKINKSREPLSQFVQHKMPVFNDDTQSENDSMDEMKEEFAKEASNLKNGKSALNKQQEEVDQTLDQTETMNISLYRQYLDWFTQNELMRVVPTSTLPKAEEKVSKPIQSQNKIESEITKPESDKNPSAQMTISPPKFSATEQTEIQQDIEMIEEEEQKPLVPLQQQQSAPAPAETIAQIFPEYNHEELTESIISNSEDEASQESEYVDNYKQVVQKKIDNEIMRNEEIQQVKSQPIRAAAPIHAAAPVRALAPALIIKEEETAFIEEEEEPAFVEPEIVESQNFDDFEIDLTQRQEDLELDLSIVHQKQQINNQFLIQSNKKLTDTNFKIQKLQSEINTFEGLIQTRSQEFEEKQQQFEDEYQKQKSNLLLERQANEQFEQQLIAQDEQQLANLANLSELDQQIQSMEIEIAKKTREMQLRVQHLKLMKQIKTLDETHQAAMKQNISNYEEKEKEGELQKEISKTQKHIVDLLDELTTIEAKKAEQENLKIDLQKEYAGIQQQIQQNAAEQESQRKKEQEAKLLKEQQERANQERINQEKIRQEKARQEQIRKEQEKQRIELEQKRIELEQKRIQQEQIEREEQEKEKEQELERQRISQIQQVQSEQEKLKQQQQVQVDEEKERRIEMEKRKMIMIQQQRMKLEQIEKQRLQMMKDEEEAQKNEDQEIDDEDLDWQEGEQNERSYDEEEEWKRNMEIQQNIAQQERQKYIESMGQKFASGLNKEIRKCETRDLARRDIKSKNNNDKLHDFMQIKKIKQDKLDQQRRQIQGENSSSAPDSKEDSLKDTTDDQKLKYIKDCSNYKKNDDQKEQQAGANENQSSFKSSSKFVSETVSGEENIEKYNLFDNDNKNQNEKEQNDKGKMVEVSSDYNQDQTSTPNDIALDSRQSPQKQERNSFESPQKSNGSEVDAETLQKNVDFEAMKQQIAFLQKSLLNVTQQLNTHQQFSQQGSASGQKQASPLATLVDEQQQQVEVTAKDVSDFKLGDAPSQEDDYLLPSFGSQVQVPRAPVAEPAVAVKPFTPNSHQKLKRTFSEMENQTLGRNALADLADQRRIEEHKKKIEHEKKKKYERDMQLKHQVRKSIGHPNPELHQHTQNHNGQSIEASQRHRDRQRARSQSQDRQQPMQNPRARIDPNQVNGGKPGPNAPRRPVDGSKQQPSDPNPRHGGQMMGGANRMDGPKRHTAHSQYVNAEHPRPRHHDKDVVQQSNESLKRRRYSETNNIE